MLTGPDPASAYDRIAWGGRQAVIAAFSGGSDSTALLLTLRRWQQEHLPELEIVAVTVDHGLRPESAAEAEAAGASCARLGVPHRTLVWKEARHGPAMAARARAARYRLLAQGAEEAGTDLILTGHTADDQAETVWMRQRRGDGRGLAGMAPATLHEGRFWILRPLLGHHRSQLRALLAAEGLGWIDDPTNENPAHERVRARRRLAGDPALKASLLELARRKGRERKTEAVRQARQIDEGARMVAPGLVRLGPAFAQHDHAGALRVLLACCGGVPFLPGLEQTHHLQEKLAHGAATLSRTLVTATRDGIFLQRELRDLPEEDQDGCFDGRFRLRAPGFRLRRNSAVEGKGREARALAAAPLVEGAGGPVPVPEIVLAPFEQFLPCFDLPVAAAAARLFSRQPFPEPPVARAEF